jgi:hypothetical protein
MCGINIFMLKKINYTVDLKLIHEATNNLPKINFRYAINEPTGDFFYDPWKIKNDYIGSVWDKLLNSLPFEIGEARIICLEPKQCYQSHADIDDRYHLNLAGDCAYLINLNKKEMFQLTTDLSWYELDAGELHSAVNFGRINRIQLVVRKLLNRSIFNDSVQIKITNGNNYSEDHARFLFDERLSPFLNRANKSNIINSFSFSNGIISFNLDRKALGELKKCIVEGFIIEHD